MNTQQEITLTDCIDYQSGTGKYIDGDKLLQFLQERVKIITEQTATPGLKIKLTERLRGQRVELLNLTNQLEKELTNV